MPSVKQNFRYDEITEKLEEAEWRESKTYLGTQEEVYFSDIGRLLVTDTSDRDSEHDYELLYFEERFNPITVKTGERDEISSTVDKILEE